MSGPTTPGTRIRLIAMPEDPDPIPVGATGTVRAHRAPGSDLEQVSVDWDLPRSLNLIPGRDEWEEINDTP